MTSMVQMDRESLHETTEESLVELGLERIDWARREMAVVRSIEERFAAERPFAGLRVSFCVHITTETANAIRALKAGGADLLVAASNPLSTQQDVRDAVIETMGVPVLAKRGMDKEEYFNNIEQLCDHKPHLVCDDGGDLIAALHRRDSESCAMVLGATEQTTSGVHRIRALADQNKLRFPVFVINDAQTKHFFDNRYGTGQSALQGILQATNRLICGKVLVVGGYGWCGRGLAQRGRGLGANVVVTEVNPVRALEAVMDGFRVMPMNEAARIGDIFAIATGNVNVLDARHFEVMKDGVLLANAGHSDVEINVAALASMASHKETLRDHIARYHLEDGRAVNLLAEGRLVNLVVGEGHPSAVMDMTFANHLICAELIAKGNGRYAPGVHDVSEEIDQEIAATKLQSINVDFDLLTEEQTTYLSSWM